MAGVPARVLVTRTCVMCDWRREAVESGPQEVGCPVCYAPTRVLNQELLVPLLDVDLSVESIRNPRGFPLVSKLGS